MALFLEKTYDSTTMNDVMRKLDIAKGTIYHYFPSKDAMLDAVVEQMAASYVERRMPLVAACDGGALAPTRFQRKRISRL